jgi:hypothetical protein
MIKKYQKKGMFDIPSIFSPTNYKDNKDLTLPKKPSLFTTPNFEADYDPNQTLDTPQKQVALGSSLNTSNPNFATGVEQNPLTATGVNSGNREAMGASITGGGNSPFKLKTSFDDLTKGVKGDGIKSTELLQMGLPYLLDAFMKPKGANLKRTQDVINPATGLPYETINQVEQGVNRSLVGASRNKSTDILTNAVNMNMVQSNANQQLQGLYTKNAEQYLGDKRRMIGEINKNKDANDDFYNKAEMMRAEADAQNINNKKMMFTNTANQLGQIQAQNQASKNAKKEALLPMYQKMAQQQFEKQYGNEIQEGVNAANEIQRLQGEVAAFKQLDASTQDKTNPAYLEAKKKAELAESTLTTQKNKYEQAINRRNQLQGQFDNALNQQFIKQIKGEKGLLFKKGGSLSVEERKNLKEHEYSLKEKLNKVKEQAKQASERVKELKKQEIEFRKELAKNHSNNSKIIANFYKSNKK